MIRKLGSGHATFQTLHVTQALINQLVFAEISAPSPLNNLLPTL